MTTEWAVLRSDLERQEQENKALQAKVTRYEEILGVNEANNEYKDRLFKFIFGNPNNKRWTLALYNAVNGTQYKDSEEIQFNTLGDFLYLKMKNDVSFIISFEMNLWEHQSSFNPNMPMRFLRYGTHLYEKYIATTDYYEYSSRLQKIPRPLCVCFYNGLKSQPEKQVLRLSDAYDGKGDIEVTVNMININYGKNPELMKSCEPLREYSWLVEEIRKGQEMGKLLVQAVDDAVNLMPDDFVIKPFIIVNRAEVKSMLFVEYNEEKIRESDRAEGKLELLWQLVKEGVITKEVAAAREAEIRTGYVALSEPSAQYQVDDQE